MSSIDKGVEQVARSTGRYVRVEKIGNMIYGYMDGQQVFSLHDRYGYVNEEEKRTILSGIENYEYRKRLADEERRAREEAMRRVREEEERRRREQEERNRKAALDNLRTEIAKRIKAANSLRAENQNMIKTAAANDATERAVLGSLIKANPALDLSAFENRLLRDRKKVSDISEQNEKQIGEYLRKIETLSATVKNSFTLSESANTLSLLKSIKAPVSANASGTYEKDKFIAELKNIENGLLQVNALIESLKEFQNAEDKTGVAAKGALDAIQGYKISSLEDVKNLVKRVNVSVNDISQIVNTERIDSRFSQLAKMQGTMNACKKVYSIQDVSTYTAKNYRDEILSNVINLTEKFNSLEDAEYTTCSETRRNSIISRLKNIMDGSDDSYEILKDVKAIESEYIEIIQADNLHKHEYDEYKSYIDQLTRNGVPSEEMPDFNVDNYSAQREELASKLYTAKREKQKSLVIETEIYSRNVMEEMGYETFSMIGDSEGYIRETLYTKPGYDGVMWQIITYSNGSISRRIIGVNKEDSQTDISYLKNIAKEMDDSGEPAEFLKRYKEAGGLNLNVTSYCEHDSEDADSMIAQHGYYYLTGDELRTYNLRVADIKKEATVKKKESQVQLGKDAVRIQSTRQELRRCANASRAMSHAH